MMNLGDAWYTEDYETVTAPEVYDTRDYWAQNGAPVASSATPNSNSFSFSDLLKAGTTVISEAMKYRSTTLPNGSTIYTRMDAATGQPAVVGSKSVGMDFVKNNIVVIGLAGAALLFLTSSPSKGK